MIEEHTPTVASTLEISEKALAALDQGMRMTGSIGTCLLYTSPDCGLTRLPEKSAKAAR